MREKGNVFMKRTKFAALAILAAGAAVSLAVTVPAAQASQVAGPTNPALNGVAETSSSSGWSVGYSANSTTGFQPLIMRWNGTALSQVTSPNVGTYAQLVGVGADSSTDAWAVGHYFKTGTSISQSLILHWNGSAWKQVTSPNPGTEANDLNSVKVISPTNAWAVGSYQNQGNLSPTLTFIAHWNGTSWTKVTSPQPGTNNAVLNSVSAASATDAWAVGTFVTTSGLAVSLTLHWNGTTWTRATSPDPGSKGNYLNGVTELSPTDAWAVGSDITGSNVWQTLMLHWNGTSWAKVTAPSPAGTTAFPELNGVAADSATDAWAVGTYWATGGTKLTTITLHYNGTSWSQVASPSNSSDNETLQSVAAVSRTSALTVGHGKTGSLILHWTGTTWTKLPNP